MLAGSGAPPPEEIQLKENISSGSYPKKTDSEYWPVISANALTELSDGYREVGFWELNRKSRITGKSEVTAKIHQSSDNSVAIAKSFLLESECVNLLNAAIAHKQNLAIRSQPKPLGERINKLREVFEAQDFF